MASVDEGCVENRIRSFMVLDLETTGLPYDKPVRITEISVVAALREHILGYGSDRAGSSLPRVLSKVTMCVSPRKIISERAGIITRLTNDLLEHQSPFDENLFYTLDGFMKRMPHPVCIIAHNGLRFDFPILQAELHRIGKAFPDHIMCADSLTGFRKLLPSSKYVETCNGTTADVGLSSLLTGIQPLNNDHLLQDQQATKQACTEFNGLTSELEVSDLHVNDYDEALCSAVDAVETDSVSESNVRDNSNYVCFDDIDDLICSYAVDTVEGRLMKEKDTEVISGSPEKVEEGSPMGNEVSVRQKVLERTPPHSISEKEKYSYPSGGDSSDMTPQAETSGNVIGTRHHKNIVCHARRKLPFSSHKSPNVTRSYKLQDVYRLLLKREPINTHSAENDALSLLECIVALGQSFIDWVDENAVQFNSIKKVV